MWRQNDTIYRLTSIWKCSWPEKDNALKLAATHLSTQWPYPWKPRIKRPSGCRENLNSMRVKFVVAQDACLNRVLIPPTSETNKSMMIIEFKHVVYSKISGLTRGIMDRKPYQKIQYRQWDTIFHISCKYSERHQCHDVSALLASLSFFHCTDQSIVVSQVLRTWSLLQKMPWCVIWRHIR